MAVSKKTSSASKAQNLTAADLKALETKLASVEAENKKLKQSLELLAKKVEEAEAKAKNTSNHDPRVDRIISILRNKFPPFQKAW